MTSGARLARPASLPLASELALIGEELEARATEVCDAVLEWWLDRHPEHSDHAAAQVRSDILDTTEVGTLVLSRFLTTGQLPSSSERDLIAAPGKAPINRTIAIGELTKLYLAWRDISLQKLEAIADRLGVSGAALRAAEDAVRAGADSALVNMVRQFDAAHRQLQRQLAAERERLAHNAVHDALTGLPNRTLLVDRLEQLASGRRRTSFAVLFVDIDRFKSVNDRAGHAVGDELLVAVASRLRGVIRAGDTLARLGGDEFVILCPDLGDAHLEAAAVAERVTAVLAQPFRLGRPEQEFYVSASVGIGIAGDQDSSESIISRADAAMYAAKRRGGSGHEVYDESVDQSLRRRPELLNDLHGALARGELFVQYQPVVALASGRVVTMEALARWNHPRFGAVPPDEFIPLAEESGVIAELGRWVLSRAIEDCARWQSAGRPDVGVAVNVSGRQLGDEGLADFLRQLLEQTGVEPAKVTLEITESVIVTGEVVTQRALSALKATGVLLAIDDFGTGYSSLSYLRQLPIDVLKVDRTFVSSLGVPGSDTAIVSAMVQLAHSLRLAVIAEGVETDTELEMVRQAGCDEAQGYLLGRPGPA